jgi:DNA-binding NtrC family response regulator
MNRAQVLAYGLADPLLGRLKSAAQDPGFWLREVQHLETCRNLLRQAEPPVLVLMVSKDIFGELTILQEVSQAFPDTAVIVVGDHENPLLATLAWDLGASYVLQPPQPIEVLPDPLLRIVRRSEK